MSNSSIPDWFAQFKNFTFDPTVGIKSNFNRLAGIRGWRKQLKAKKWMNCQTALFDSLYGTDISKLEIWQDLCREVYINNPPNSIKGCKKVLGSRNVRVNLVNLIDHRLTGAYVIRFPSDDKFWEYTSAGRKFPLDAAKKDGFIRSLLRKL